MSVFVPTFDDQANLIVGYSRADKFPINNYTQMVTVNKMIGLYLKFEPKDQSRVPFFTQSTTNTNVGNNWVFADGQRRSLQDGKDTNSRFGYISYTLQRFSPKGTLGYLTLEQAQWDVKKKILDDLAFKAMIQRTIRANAVMSDTSQYASNHYSASSSSIGGGAWNAGTINNPYIKQACLTMRNQILLDSLGGVQPSDLCLIMNPNGAKTTADTQEIHAYLAQQVDSGKMIEGKYPNVAENYGIPPMLYGFKVIVENTVITTNSSGSGLENTNPDVLDSTSFVFADNQVFVASRPGAIPGEAGGNSFCSVTCLEFEGEEMVSEMFDIPEDKLCNFYITDTNIFLLTSPETFYNIGNITA